MTQYRVTGKAEGKRTSQVFNAEQAATRQFNKLRKAVEADGNGFAKMESKEDASSDNWFVLNEIILEDDDN